MASAAAPTAPAGAAHHTHIAHPPAAPSSPAGPSLAAPGRASSRPCRVSLLAPTAPGTGNRTTSERIARQLQTTTPTPAAGACEVRAYSTIEPDSRAALEAAVHAQQVDVLIGLHAYRAGQYLLPLVKRHAHIPLIIILGGTDVNEMLSLDCARPVIVEVLCEAADAIVCFTRAMEEKVRALWRHHPGRNHGSDTPSTGGDDGGRKCTRRPCRLVYIPQAVDLPVLPSVRRSSQTDACPCAQEFCIRKKLGISPSDFLFLLPCTLRAVKDPFFLAGSFERWHRARPDVHLVIVGSLVDPEYQPMARRYANPRWDAATAHDNGVQPCTAEPLSAGISSTPLAASPPPATSSYTGVTWCDSLAEATEFLPSLRCASALVNTSLSEGMSGAILESMALGVPVLARRNEGNCAIIRESERDDHDRGVESDDEEARRQLPTGLMFSTADEFLVQAEKMCAEWTPISCAANPQAEPARRTPVSATAPGVPQQPPTAEIVAAAKVYVGAHHSVPAETAAYAALVGELFSEAGSNMT